MPKSAIEERLAKAFADLNPELKRMILPAFEADFAARGARSTDRLRLVKPSAAAASASSSAMTHIADQLQQLAAIAPHEFQELRQEIDRRLVIVQRAQAAHIEWSSERPWPWPLFYAVRKAPGASAAARILVTVLGLGPTEIRPLVRLAGCIQSADPRSARIILNWILGEYVELSEAARFERED